MNKMNNQKIITAIEINNTKKQPRIRKGLPPFTEKLIELFEKQENPEIIIEFIYKNLYELLAEIDLLDDVYYDLLTDLYNRYEDKVISRENWLLTLFPSFIFSLKNFYIGIAGRLAFFSNKKAKSKYFKFYWYIDHRINRRSYYFDIDENKSLLIDKCQFMVFDEYKNCKLLENKNTLHDYSYVFYIYRTHWLDEYSKKKLEKLEASDEITDEEQARIQEILYEFKKETIYESDCHEKGLRYSSILEELPQRIQQYKANANLPCVLYKEDSWRLRQKQGYNELIGEAWYQTYVDKKDVMGVDVDGIEKGITERVINSPEELKLEIYNKKNPEIYKEQMRIKIKESNRATNRQFFFIIFTYLVRKEIEIANKEFNEKIQ